MHDELCPRSPNTLVAVNDCIYCEVIKKVREQGNSDDASS